MARILMHRHFRNIYIYNHNNMIEVDEFHHRMQASKRPFCGCLPSNPPQAVRYRSSSSKTLINQCWGGGPSVIYRAGDLRRSLIWFAAFKARSERAIQTTSSGMTSNPCPKIGSSRGFEFYQPQHPKNNNNKWQNSSVSETFGGDTWQCAGRFSKRVRSYVAKRTSLPLWLAKYMHPFLTC